MPVGTELMSFSTPISREYSVSHVDWTQDSEIQHGLDEDFEENGRKGPIRTDTDMVPLVLRPCRPRVDDSRCFQKCTSITCHRQRVYSSMVL